MARRLAAVLVGLCVAATVNAPGGGPRAEEHRHEALPSVEDVIHFRHYLMENLGDNAKDMKAKLAGDRVKEIAVNAGAVALHATRIPALFPEGTRSAHSRAKEEIWREWDEFRDGARRLAAQADRLAQVAAGRG